MKHTDKQGFWYGFNAMAVFLIIFFVLIVPLLVALGAYTQSVSITASQTSVAQVQTPSTFTIDIYNGSTTPLNAIEFELHFEPKALMITSITSHSELCEERFIITNTISNASGTALFQCGTITPFTDTVASIATVEVIPLTAGTSSIVFGEQTHILAHDGFGTDVTKVTHNLIFTAL